MFCTWLTSVGIWFIMAAYLSRRLVLTFPAHTGQPHLCLLVRELTAADQTCPNSHCHHTFLWLPGVSIPFNVGCHWAEISGSSVAMSLKPGKVLRPEQYGQPEPCANSGLILMSKTTLPPHPPVTVRRHHFRGNTAAHTHMPLRGDIRVKVLKVVLPGYYDFSHANRASCTACA